MRTRQLFGSSLLFALVFSSVFSSGCGHASDGSTPNDAGVDASSLDVAEVAPPEPHPRAGKADAVFVEGSTFRDGQGRQLLFRGFNTKVNGIFDVTFADGRKPNYTFPDFDEAGAKRFEELGFDVIRLCINWSALEPQPKAYSKEFFAKVDAILALAKAHHFRVLLDMHQDGYSKEIGEDGAPLWAIVPAPEKLLEGPSDDGRRLSAQVIAAGTSFWNDAELPDGRTLQQAFFEAVGTMVRRYVGDETIVGIEAWNEPVAFDVESDTVGLWAFHRRFADVIHQLDGDLAVFFEPNGTRNQWDTASKPYTPWGNGPGVYAPHIYTGQFSIPSQNGWESEDPAKLLPSMQNASEEAAAWGTPWFVTEFGCNEAQPRGIHWISEELNLQDRFLASSTLWAWEPGDWSPRFDVAVKGRPESMRVVSRSYPRAVAGDLLAIERPTPGTMNVRYRATTRTKGLAHEISASADFVTDWKISCDGVDVTGSVTKAPGRATFICPWSEGEHTFSLFGTPVPLP